jgi:hypothetical protein
MSSCSSVQKANAKNPQTPNVEKEKEKIAEVSKTISEVASGIGAKADTIDKHTNSIENKSTDEEKQNIAVDIKGIKDETQGLRNDKTTLLITEEKLKDTQTQLEEQQNLIKEYTAFTQKSQVEIAKLQEKIKELESSNQKLLKTMMAWISVCCVVGIGACLVIGAFFKTPTAFIIAAGCLVTLGVSVAVSIYVQYIAWIALVLLGIGFVIAVIYVAWQIKTQDKAVSELVHTGEVVKTFLPNDSREKIFGNKVLPGVAHVIQSDSTMSIVRKIRNKAKKINNIGIAPSVA